MKNYTTKIFLYGILSCCILQGCKKYLAEKSDQKLVVPQTFDQMQALLDSYNTMNIYCAAGEESCDDYYLTNDDYNGLNYDFEKRIYIWDKDYLFDLGTNGNDWLNTYTAIYSSNTVLSILQNTARTSANATTWDDLKGESLFFRGTHLLDAAYVWTLAYDPATSSSDLGLPIRLTTDFNQPSVRSTVAQTYAQALLDIQSSIPLLPIVPLSTYRPSKPAAYGYLARAELSMGNYKQAGLYADSCIQLGNKLMDFNSLDTTASYPITQFNSEALFYSVQQVVDPLLFSTPKADTVLLASYAAKDLRRAVFFQSNGDGTYSFRGSYDGDFTLYSGPATDEMYLIRAECHVRNGDVKDGLADLNTLLKTRFLTNTFIPYANLGQAAALTLILNERRKELVMRGLRWPDLKRFNKESPVITLTRNINGEQYVLKPNDLRYALPIPEDIISNSSMPQNPR